MAAFIPTIFVEDQQVIASGTVVSRGTSKIVFNPLETNPTYRVEILFELRDGEKPGLTFEVVDSFVRITCKNIDSTLGSATSSPFYVARQQGRKVMLDFAMSIIGEGKTACRVFNYCFYDGGSSDV